MWLTRRVAKLNWSPKLKAAAQRTRGLAAAPTAGSSATELDAERANLYAELHFAGPEVVDFYRDQGVGRQAVLELGCGDARILQAIARRRVVF